MLGWKVMPLLLAASMALGALARAEAATSRCATLSAEEASEQGLIAALEDPDDEVVARALLRLDGKVKAEPTLQNTLLSFLQGPRAQRALSEGKGLLWKAAVITQATLVTQATQEETPPEMAERLIDLLRDPDPQVREAAATALGNLGEAARAQVPRLVELLKLPVDLSRDPPDLLNTPRQSIRKQSARVLGNLGEAARAQVPRLVELLKDPDPKVRGAAVEALGNLGEVARRQAPLLVQVRLKDPDPNVRRTAVLALGNLGEAASDEVPHLVTLLKASDPKSRGAAAQMLGHIIEGVREHLPRIGQRLEDRDPSVRALAAEALGHLGRAGENITPQAPRLGALLEDPNRDVRLQAALALGSMGEAAQEYVPRLVKLLKDPDRWVRLEAKQALNRLGPFAGPQEPRLLGLLEDPDPEVRESAARLLGRMGAGERIPRLVALLKDDQPPIVRAAAARALGELGASEQARDLSGLLKDQNRSVREAAAEALGALHERDYLPHLIELLGADEGQSGAPSAAWQALIAMAPLEEPYAALLAVTGQEPSARPMRLLRAYAAGGCEPHVARVLRWLGGRTVGQLPSEYDLTLDDARATLRDFERLWPYTQEYLALQKDLARQTSEVALRGGVQWTRADRALLQRHKNWLESLQPRSAELEDGIHELGKVIGSIPRGPSLETFGWSWAVHAGFWLLLIFVYPRSGRVQALFFWNPWVRRILGLGYVGLLLTWVPFLRRRLLAPFHDLLRAEAHLGSFSQRMDFRRMYFDRAEVRSSSSGQRLPLLEALSDLRGQVLLEGASGLGKSTFIKHLLSTSERLAVYLPAPVLVTEGAAHHGQPPRALPGQTRLRSLRRRGRARRRHLRQRQQGWARAAGRNAHRGSTRRECCAAFSRWTSSAAPGAGAGGGCWRT